MFEWLRRLHHREPASIDVSISDSDTDDEMRECNIDHRRFVENVERQLEENEKRLRMLELERDVIKRTSK